MEQVELNEFTKQYISLCFESIYGVAPNNDVEIERFVSIINDDLTEEEINRLKINFHLDGTDQISLFEFYMTDEDREIEKRAIQKLRHPARKRRIYETIN